MPAKAKPKPPPPAPPKLVQSAGKQEDFRELAIDLAAKLGWEGDLEWVTNDIAVGDAQNYIAKVMHEHFQAGALGHLQPSYLNACEHLAVDNPDEQAAIDAALASAYENGKGKPIDINKAVTSNMNASLDVTGKTSGKAGG